MKARVYRNLRKKAYSVQNIKTRLVVGVHPEVLMYDATFKVSEAGRQRVIREKQKNVHAFVVGTVSPLGPRGALVLVPKDRIVKVSYNPYKFGHFYATDTGLPVLSADIVCLLEEGVYAIGVTYPEGAEWA
jgi:hypothetical protein